MRTPQNKLIVPSLILAAGIAMAPFAVQAAIAGATSATSSTGTAYCPSGYRATGGGFSMASNTYSNSYSTEYFVTSSNMYGSNGWRTSGYKINGTYSTSNGWRYTKSSYYPPTRVMCVK